MRNINEKEKIPQSLNFMTGEIIADALSSKRLNPSFKTNSRQISENVDDPFSPWQPLRLAETDQGCNTDNNCPSQTDNNCPQTTSNACDNTDETCPSVQDCKPTDNCPPPETLGPSCNETNDCQTDECTDNCQTDECVAGKMAGNHLSLRNQQRHILI